MVAWTCPVCQWSVEADNNNVLRDWQRDHILTHQTVGFDLGVEAVGGLAIRKVGGVVAVERRTYTLTGADKDWLHRLAIDPDR